MGRDKSIINKVVPIREYRPCDAASLIHPDKPLKLTGANYVTYKYTDEIVSCHTKNSCNENHGHF